MEKKLKIYVASSWRNDQQQSVVEFLRLEGHEVYNFKNPEPDRPGEHGFHWSEIDPNWKNWTSSEYMKAMNHPIANFGYKRDFNAMVRSDACLLLLPCGRSAHIEAGYFVGADKFLVIMTCDGQEPELMYKMANRVVNNIEDASIAFEWYHTELMKNRYCTKTVTT